MPMSVQQLQTILGRQGLEVTKKKWDSDYLQNIIAVDTLIDIGVGSGTPELHKKTIAKHFILIDPNDVGDHVVAQIRSFGGTVETRKLALGSTAGVAPLLRQANPNRSSLYTRTPLSARDPHPAETIDVEIATLDNMLADDRLSLGCYGIKIDTEGAELDILRGGTEVLKGADFVIIETSVKRRFDNTYKPSELIAEMARHNFEPADILNHPGQTPLFLDILFLPWSSSVFDRIR